MRVSVFFSSKLLGFLPFQFSYTVNLASVCGLVETQNTFLGYQQACGIAVALDSGLGMQLSEQLCHSFYSSV